MMHTISPGLQRLIILMAVAQVAGLYALARFFAA